MIEATGNLWTAAEDADALCVTTNGSLVRLSAGVRGVMGRGVALQAKRRYAHIERRLGELIRDHGNHVHCLFDDHALCPIYSFPVKHLWMQNADLHLIERSAQEIVTEANAQGYQRVLLPRPGCGNGGLQWDDVRPVIEQILDDRFTVMEWAA